MSDIIGQNVIREKQLINEDEIRMIKVFTSYHGMCGGAHTPRYLEGKKAFNNSADTVRHLI